MGIGVCFTDMAASSRARTQQEFIIEICLHIQVNG